MRVHVRRSISKTHKHGFKFYYGRTPQILGDFTIRDLKEALSLQVSFTSKITNEQIRLIKNKLEKLCGEVVYK